MVKFALITSQADTFTNPTLVGLIEKLHQMGVELHLIGPPVTPDEQRKYSFVNFFFTNLMVYRFGMHPRFIMQTYSIAQYLKQHNIKSVAGIDPLGIYYAASAKNFCQFSLGFFSFEILVENEIKSDKALCRLKKQEHKKSGMADYVLIQDSERLELLKENNYLNPKARVFEIPVSPIVCNDFKRVRSADFLNIPTNKTRLVSAGSFDYWSGAETMLEFVKTQVDGQFWLTIHCKAYNENKYIQEAKKLAAENYPVTVHQKPFSDVKEYYSFLSNFDIGLAFYCPDYLHKYTGKNIEKIGLSSGKLSTYALIGLPVVFFASGIYNQLNSQYSFGEAVTEKVNLAQAALAVVENYPKAKLGVENLYREVLQVDTKLQELAKFIYQL